ncbi:MAG: hypothetical protein IJ601_04295 [Acidaminococcaceae bacterium]|nr:hypothetical protein [Acidaminococcaceae bacterium]
MFFFKDNYKKNQFCFKRFTKQCRFKGESSTTTTYTPTEEEKEMQKLQLAFAKEQMPYAQKLNKTAADLLWDSAGSTQVDFDTLNDKAQKQIANASGTVSGLMQGKLPSAYQQNMQDIINRGVQSSAGNLLNGLAQRGVINSSVMNQGMKDISDSAASAMTDAYTQNVGLLSQLAGQQTDAATAGIAAGAAAQEAAQQPALNLWQASLGLSPAGSGALSAVAGKGTTTQSTSGGGGFWGGLASGIGGGLVGLFCFIGGTKIDTPHGKVKIRNIKKGDKVISYNPETGEDHITTVVKTSEPHLEKVYTVQAKDEYGVKHYAVTTASQPFMRPDGSYITVDKVIVDHTELMGVGMIENIAYNGKQLVYDFCVDNFHNYYANGFVAQDGSEAWGKE